jgi:hypothetical protein
VVEHVGIAIATSLNFFYDCGKICSMKARLRKNGIDRNYDKYYSRNCVLASGMSVASFDMNVRLVLAMEETGGGQAEASVTGGMLDLCPDVMLHTFTTVEEDICVLERQLGKEQLEENVELEKQLSEKDDDDEIRLAVAGDMPWDQWVP